MDVILRAAIAYLLLIIALRLTTRRMVKSATPLDMAIIFLFGGMATQAILGEDRSLTQGFLAVATIAALHITISMVRPHFPILGSITEGTPVIVFSHGEMNYAELRRLRVQEKDILAELRQHDLASLDEVQFVVVEHNGGITFVKRAPDAATQ